LVIMPAKTTTSPPPQPIPQIWDMMMIMATIKSYVEFYNKQRPILNLYFKMMKSKF